MEIFVGGRGTGKTRKLLEKAAEEQAWVICSNVDAMQEKAKAYNIEGLHFMSYEDFFHANSFNQSYQEQKASGVRTLSDADYNECDRWLAPWINGNKFFIDDIESYLHSTNVNISGFTVCDSDK